jgi:hypothetical protein
VKTFQLNWISLSYEFDGGLCIRLLYNNKDEDESAESEEDLIVDKRAEDDVTDNAEQEQQDNAEEKPVQKSFKVSEIFHIQKCKSLLI